MGGIRYQKSLEWKQVCASSFLDKLMLLLRHTEVHMSTTHRMNWKKNIGNDKNRKRARKGEIVGVVAIVYM